MEILSIVGRTVLTSLFSIIVLLAMTKLMGRRQVAQLSLYDYITGITIGSSAAEAASADWNEIWAPMTAIVVYGLATAALSLLTERSQKLRVAMTGRPIVLYDNGKINEANLAQAKIDVNELLSQARISGYFDLSELRCVWLEPNGSMSFLPLADKRPLTPEDQNLHPAQSTPVFPVILDGRVIERGLRSAGRDARWLQKNLREQGYPAAEQIILATCDGAGTLTVYPYQRKKHPS